jgi:hypothetical protein
MIGKIRENVNPIYGCGQARLIDLVAGGLWLTWRMTG